MKAIISFFEAILIWASSGHAHENNICLQRSKESRVQSRRKLGGGGDVYKKEGEGCVFIISTQFAPFFFPFDATAHAALSTILVHLHGQLYKRTFVCSEAQS